MFTVLKQRMSSDDSKEYSKFLAEFKEILTDIQIDYKNNLRQHLYSISVLRKVLHYNKNDKVTFPKRLSYWPRKQTAEFLKRKLKYDYVDEYEDHNSIVDVQVAKKRKKTLKNTNEKEAEMENMFKHEVYSSFQRKVLEKLLKNSKNDEDADRITEKFLSLMESNINKKRNEITDNITITFDDIIRGINYTQKSSDKKAISYKNVLENCDIIYEDIDDETRFDALKSKLGTMFSKTAIAEKYVDDKFKLHGEVIISESESDMDNNSVSS